MRNLEEIQNDLKINSGSLNKTTIRSLRKEEFYALDQLLLKEDGDYRAVSVKVLKCIDATDWQMKVNGRDGNGRNGSKIVSGEGWINEQGIMGCKLAWQHGLVFNYQVSKFAGTIDHFGTVKLVPVDHITMPLYAPVSYYASAWSSGDFALQMTRKSSMMTLDNIVTSLTGDVFENNTEMRKYFLREREKLYTMIRNNRLKA